MTDFFIPESMTSTQTTILMTRLKNLTGADVTRRNQVILSTDDERVASILKILLGDTQPETPAEKPVKRGRKPNSMAEDESSKSWELVDGDNQVVESLTIEQKSMRLAAGKFPVGARLRYVKNGKYFTVVGDGAGKPQKLFG
mgnify:CR=1 FL=1